MRNPTSVCLGRMRLTVPGPVSILYVEQEIDDVEITVQTLLPGQSQAQAWADFVALTTESRAFAGGRSAVIAKSVVAGQPALLQRLADSPDSNIALDVWFPRGTHILKLRSQGAPSERPLLEPSVLHVLPAIEMRDGLLPEISDFCVQGGVVHLPPESGESISATVIFDTDRYQFDAKTVVQKQAYPPNLLRRWNEEVLPNTLELGLKTHVRLRESMRWNGSKAEQIASTAIVHDPGQTPTPQQDAQFVSSGIAGDAYHPYVDLKLTNYYPPPDNSRTDDDFIALWLNIVRSITFSGGAQHGSR